MSLFSLSVYCINVLNMLMILTVIYFIAAFTFVIAYTNICRK